MSITIIIVLAIVMAIPTIILLKIWLLRANKAVIKRHRSVYPPYIVTFIPDGKVFIDTYKREK